MSLAATATMILMLILLAGFCIVQTGLLAGLDFVEQKVEVVADLRTRRHAGRGRRPPGADRALPEVARSTYVTRTRPSPRFRAALAAQGEEDLTAYLDDNPLHASLEVKLRSRRTSATSSRASAAEPAVERVKNISDSSTGS